MMHLPLLSLVTLPFALAMSDHLYPHWMKEGQEAHNRERMIGFSSSNFPLDDSISSHDIHFGLPQEHDLINPILSQPVYYYDHEFDPTLDLSLASTSSEMHPSLVEPDTSLTLGCASNAISPYWFDHASHHDRVYIATLLAHYWGRRFKDGEITPSFYALLSPCITAEIAAILLDPNTPIDYLVQVISALPEASGKAYAQSIYDMKALISKRYDLCRKTVDRYVQRLMKEGWQGVSANVLYMECLHRWNETNPDRRIVIQEYTPWQPNLTDLNLSL